MRNVYLLLFFLTLTVITTAQTKTGSIKGIVKTADGSPAEFINVILKGTNKGSSTNSKGEFEIKHTAPGNYLLLVSFIGLESTEHHIDVKEGETTILPEIVLNEHKRKIVSK